MSDAVPLRVLIPGKTSRSQKQLLACTLVVVVASLLASLIQSSGGRVQVMDLKIPTQNGQWLVADLFRPRSATSKQPAPLVIVVPGFSAPKNRWLIFPSNWRGGAWWLSPSIRTLRAAQVPRRPPSPPPPKAMGYSRW